MSRDMVEWLDGLGLGRYAQLFGEHEIDLDALPYITEDDLKEMQVALGARRKLLAAISALADGQPAASTTEPPADLPAEQRQVTVLFADMAGFTQLSAELGAEATHGLLNRYFETVDGIVERYGGSVDKHMGDNVMAVFGAPVAHSDDPERAARAALEIHQAMSRLSEEFARRLEAHIGLASGQVVASGTGSEAHSEYTVTGSSVNLASRLQDQAEAGQTLVSQAVQRAISDRAETAPLGDIRVKGFAEPVLVWRLEGLRSDVSRARRNPFVGRQAERRQFSAVIEACRQTGEGQTILVRGEAGIGKTRLMEELASLAEAAGFATHKGLVLDFGVGEGQDAIRALVRSLLGLAWDDGEEARASAADRAIAADWLDEDARVFLNDLLDLPLPTALRALYDAMDNATRNRGKEAVVGTLVRSSSRSASVLLAVEDIHWADALTLSHLAGIARSVAECRAVLVMTTRIEGDPLDQAWRAALGGSPLTAMDLQPLRSAEAQELASGFADSGRSFVQDCISRAEGNPLFLEQLLHNAEEGALSEVPGSIQSLVLARMDRLEPRDKSALQAASVIGQRFDLAALRAVMEDETYDCGVLVAHCLVRGEGGGYLFAHALVQEGVYSSLLRAHKQALHVRAANCFAGHDPVLFAEHLDRAEDPGAAQAYLRAAQARAESYHYERAMRLVERGLALARLPPDRFALTCLKGRMLHDQGQIRESIEAYELALGVAEDDEDRCRAWLGLAAGQRILDRYEDALAALDLAEAIARRDALVRELAQIHHVRGNLYFPMGRIEDCREEHERSLAYACECGSAEAEALALSGLADANYMAGRMASAHRDFSRCVEVARRNGFGRIEVANRCMVGFVDLYMNRLDESLEHSAATVEAARKVGDQRAEMLGETLAVYAYCDLGEFARAHEHNQRGLALSRLLKARRFEAQHLMYHAKLLSAEGCPGEGIAAAREALSISAEVGHGFTGPRVMAALARCLPDPEARRAALAEGERMLQDESVSHNFFYFYGDAIEVSMAIGDWDEAERYATALEDFVGDEPLAWRDFVVAYGRLLAAWGRGERTSQKASEIEGLRAVAVEAGLRRFSAAIDEILKAA